VSKIDDRIKEVDRILGSLLGAPRLKFDRNLRSSLPERHGLYAISLIGAEEGEVLRSGRTKTASGGIRQRVYGNHFMGNQKGNLRCQLVADGVCSSIADTKRWIGTHCVVQYTIIDDDEARRWAEYYVLSALRPRYCD
jgi:hypothetical protein